MLEPGPPKYAELYIGRLGYFLWLWVVFWLTFEVQEPTATCSKASLLASRPPAAESAASNAQTRARRPGTSARAPGQDV